MPRGLRRRLAAASGSHRQPSLPHRRFAFRPTPEKDAQAAAGGGDEGAPQADAAAQASGNDDEDGDVQLES